MDNPFLLYRNQITEVLKAGRVKISSIKPSDWAEKNIVMPDPKEGYLKYSETPYTKEIIDCFAEDHPAREIAIMGAAQWGKTATIAVPIVGYIIANNPGNIIMTVGHDGLIDEAMAKIDFMLDTTGLRNTHIKSSAKKAKSNKTGDTRFIKEFPKGYFKISSASNYKIWQQANYKFGIIDDYDRVKKKSKEAGSVRGLIQKRFTVYSTSKKIAYISSPDLEVDSNILEVYKLGDQRKFLIPCPCCSVFIELHWSIPGHDGEPAGITWECREDGSLITESVGYKCQECGDIFNDKDKPTWVNLGYWQPTAKPFKPEMVSFHMNSLYSPLWMDRWKDYVYKWLECHPKEGGRKEAEYHAFLSLTLGLPYAPAGKQIEANTLQKNNRSYNVGDVPDKMSMSDGNGKIVMLTCACDLNGKKDDARLDYEVLAWSESGSVYSIDHGSIGTFIPGEGQHKVKEDREKWTYSHNEHNSVWPELDKILGAKYFTDTKSDHTGKDRVMKITLTTIDAGFSDTEVWQYIDYSPFQIRGVKGEKDDKYIKYGIDVPAIKKGRAHPKLYMVQGGLIKDDLAEYVELKWNKNSGVKQPANFMNYPTPSGGKYGFKNYFEHYQAEHRITQSVDGEVPSYRWVKKNSVVQNHMFDCRVYNMVAREILIFEIGQDDKIKGFGWPDLVKMFIQPSA